VTDTAFSSLPLPAAQLDNLHQLGYSAMTPVQAASLPLALAGRDLIAQARTGSGKTVAFALALLARLNPRDFGTQALILCPTRELAGQVAAEIRRLARFQQNIKVVTLCGGQSIGPQIGSLAHGAHVVVGTPGRLVDHLRKNTLDLSRVACLVLDEADRMLEMGFIEDIDTIIERTPKQRQTLLFSATFPPDMQGVSARFQRAPTRVSIDSDLRSRQIEQYFYVCTERSRAAALVRLLSHYRPEAAVVFCNTRQQVRDVCSQLENADISAAALHGEMEQRERDQILVQFRQQSIRMLVATDVAARGLDIDRLPAVVNYELPRSPEVYVHRVGRTGRAGERGIALSLLVEAERHRLDSIGDYQQCTLASADIGTVPHNSDPLPDPDYSTLCIASGRKDKLRAGDILGALTGTAGIDGAAVGRIDIGDYASYVAVRLPLADTALGRLLNGRIKGRKIKVRKL